VHFWHDPVPPSEVCKLARGSPFKSVILKVEYEPEGVMYTVRYLTDGCAHTVHISYFVREAGLEFCFY
jgi:hypothetical protein